MIELIFLKASRFLCPILIILRPYLTLLPLKLLLLLEVSSEITWYLWKVLRIFKTVIWELIHIIIVWLFLQQWVYWSWEVDFRLKEFISCKLCLKIELLLWRYPKIISLYRRLVNGYLSFGHDRRQLMLIVKLLTRKTTGLPLLNLLLLCHHLRGRLFLPRYFRILSL